jgi:hypothetical protein
LTILGPGAEPSISAAIKFMGAVWDYPASSYTFAATRCVATDKWREHPIQGDRGAQLRKILDGHPPATHDIYFCPNRYNAASRTKEYAGPTRYAWNDIDEHDPAQFVPQPNILWESSPGRHQGLWIWKNEAPGLTAEQYSRMLWKRNGGDRGGWSITKLLRVPGTINHKPHYAKPTVRLIRFDTRPQRMPLSLAFVPLSEYRTPTPSVIDPTSYDPATVIRRYRRAVGLEVRQLMTATRILRGDRSKRVFQIVVALVAAGATDNEIASVLWVNRYFVDKWGQDIVALEREIERIRGRAEANQ